MELEWKQLVFERLMMIASGRKKSHGPALVVFICLSRSLLQTWKLFKKNWFHSRQLKQSLFAVQYLQHMRLLAIAHSQMVLCSYCVLVRARARVYVCACVCVWVYIPVYACATSSNCVDTWTFSFLFFFLATFIISMYMCVFNLYCSALEATG